MTTRLFWVHNTGKDRHVFIPAHRTLIILVITKLQRVHLLCFIIVREWQSCSSSSFLTCLWLNNAVEGTTNIASVLRGLFVTICGLRDWFSPSHNIDETPPRGSSGNSSCADNFGLSYLVTVQTRVNARICFRCLSLHGSISSCFCSRLKPDWCRWFSQFCFCPSCN